MDAQDRYEEPGKEERGADAEAASEWLQEL
jgi:hypothetical protein